MTLKKIKSIPFPVLNSSLDLWQHEVGTQILVVKHATPLVDAFILVPTMIDSDCGHPHALEHLLFCDEYKGWLDLLATRCLSTGTNAYTLEDHCAYTIVTAGSHGLKHLMPVYLQHVLAPRYSPAHFVNEIHHVNGQGKLGGVVYSEMVGRENSLEDILDGALRQVSYPDSTWAHECGGLTKDLVKLDYKATKDYHAIYYQPEKVTIILLGAVNDDLLHSIDESLTKLGHSSPKVPAKISIPKPFVPTIMRREFPSTETSSGSIAFAWPGPPPNDVANVVALEVLFRYLNGTVASLIWKEFVEEKALASSVDVDLRSSLPGGIWIMFSGVPFKSAEVVEYSEVGSGSGQESGEESEEVENLDSDESMDSMDEEDDSEGSVDAMVESQSVDGHLWEDNHYLNLLKTLLESVVSRNLMTPTTMSETIYRHKVAYFQSMEQDPTDLIVAHSIPEILGDTEVGIRTTRYLDEIKLLEERNTTEFWNGLLKKWLLVSCSQVFVSPSRHLAQQLARKEKEDIEARKKALGKDGLKKAQEIVDDAIRQTSKPIPDNVLATLPVVSVDENPIPCKVVKDGSTTLVQTSTRFLHLTVGLPTHDVPDEDRPYLVLFQELFFNSPVKDGEKIIPWEEVVAITSRLAGVYGAGLGMDNDVFVTTSFSELMLIYMTGPIDKMETCIEWMKTNLNGIQWDEDRIRSVSKNLLSRIVEMKRDSDDMLSSLISWTISKSKTSVADKNDSAVNLFRQQEFLKSVLEDLPKTRRKLEDIQKVLLAGKGPGFVLAGVPVNVDKLPRLIQGPSAFPLKPHPYQWSKQDDLAMCIPGSSTSNLCQWVPVFVLGTEDYAPLLVLSDLISRTEGPLYSRIRGSGLAYGTDLSPAAWTGLLSFTLSECVDPVKGLLTFYNLMEEMDVKWNDFIKDYDVETAKSQVIYTMTASRSSPGAMVTQELKTCLRGVSIKPESVYKVSKTDLRRVWEKYFLLFFQRNQRRTAIALPKNQSIENFKQVTKEQKSTFKYLKDDSSRYTIDFRVVTAQNLAK